jgi:hypothetical protein
MKRLKAPVLGAFVALALALPAPSPASAGRSMRSVKSIEVSKFGGLGRIDVNGDRGAVLQPDEGIVAVLDTTNPARPKVLGRYDDNARQSLDGDVDVSDDGNWVFYARQTVNFSLDGLHVIDISDPSSPMLRHYAAGGGASRVEFYDDGEAQWVFLLDAVTGLVVYRFEPTTGQLVPVHADALPATKVGGPASAGIFIDPKDGGTGAPLAYITTGMTGLQVYDISDPMNPALLGAWDETGFADVFAVESGGRRYVVAAHEYWFNDALEPGVTILDATNLEKIDEVETIAFGGRPAEEERVQGIALHGKSLYVAHSTLGVGVVTAGSTRLLPYQARARNDGARVMKGPYANDLEPVGKYLYLTDAATGELLVLSP